ncbi:peptidylprolyl isomerase [Novosphingobium sp.]|uniref:peptidylprolyl isomerase n=1 Tax=Novosphingobium sp. TaxID=1874826 RepID=UPI0025F8A0A9|nr:peptidylprolyl isomerase [Novosphingobium sp.]
MRKPLLIAAALLAATPLAAQLPPPKPGDIPSPAEIVAAAPKADWHAIDRNDLLVMDLAPDAKGKPRRVVIQLLPPPFSQGWIGNIRKLAAAHWWDGLAVVRVQDNYVTQWGDPDGEDNAKARALPKGLVEVPQSEYETRLDRYELELVKQSPQPKKIDLTRIFSDPYGKSLFLFGWPYTIRSPLLDVPVKQTLAPVHCYGMVGVGRDMPPNTGSGAELYTVIGHAPRQLDRNIALVGRIIEGMEHMSSLPRGHGDLGFYDLAKGDERVPIMAVRRAAEVPDLPAYEYLDTEKASFAKYADARANRRDPFYIRPAGGVDVCNVPVPVRRAR